MSRPLSPNRRIALNVAATYARNLYSLLIGLFCGRWVLLALGEVDYGLLGTVGALMVFIKFFNSILVTGSTRFYAISIGHAKVATDKAAALEETRRWFNTTLTIETAFPVVLFAIGYPIGEWAVRHFLTIPPDRIETCIWVFRCSCLSAIVSMVCSPFNAMYSAKQYIAELTVYSVVMHTLRTIVAGYMFFHPRDGWLLPFAVYSCFANITPSVIIALRAGQLFPECRIIRRYMWDVKRLKTTLAYSGSIIMGGTVGLLRSQGVTVLVNKFYGPRVNAAMTVANHVNAEASSLSSSLMGAFTPAITTAYGTGDYRSANKLALRGCKFAILLSLLFTLPLALELPEVMRLWLKQPPRFATGLCAIMILYYLADASTTGHRIAVNAHGKIFWYNLILSAITLATLPIAVIASWMGFNVYWVGATLVLVATINSIGRTLFARHYVGMSVMYWVQRIILPSAFITAICGTIGFIPHLVMQASLMRVIVTALLSELVFIPLVWFIALDHDERSFIKEKVLDRFLGKSRAAASNS